MLTANDIYEILCQTLPEQNDFYKPDYSEELRELLHFGINTRQQLLDLVDKHKEEALSIDNEPLDDYEIQHYAEEYGKGYVEERVKGKFWYAYPALLRIILELEFGDQYRIYANERDGI
jgi:hypothetical protein